MNRDSLKSASIEQPAATFHDPMSDPMAMPLGYGTRALFVFTRSPQEFEEVAQARLAGSGPQDLIISLAEPTCRDLVAVHTARATISVMSSCRGAPAKNPSADRTIFARIVFGGAPAIGRAASGKRSSPHSSSA